MEKKRSLVGSPWMVSLWFLLIAAGWWWERGSCSTQTHELSPGFKGSQMNWVDRKGLFLLSNSSSFAFGFVATSAAGDTDPSAAFLLSVVHQPSSTVVWTANRGSPVSNSDSFFFDKDGNAFLQSSGAAVWSSNTSGKGATTMVLLDSGNLVLLAAAAATPPIWQSFSFPTDTLLTGQSFEDGMSLVSNPGGGNLTYSLRIDSGDMVLSAGFASSPQPYWSMRDDQRKIANRVSGAAVSSATISGNSWDLYDAAHSLLWQFVFTASPPAGNVTWAAVLGGDGFVSFFALQEGGSTSPSPTKIPKDPCDAPESCLPYYVCYSGTRCQCPSVLSSDANCNPVVVPSCPGSAINATSFDLAKLDDGVGYFATNFTRPSATSTNVTGCKAACFSSCNCLAVLFDQSSGDCFLFDEVGSFRFQGGGGGGNSTAVFAAYVKIYSGQRAGMGSSGGDAGGRRMNAAVPVSIAVATVLVISFIVYLAARSHRRRRRRRRWNKGAPPLPYGGGGGGSDEEDEEDVFDSISGMMPVRFTYRELETATENFSVKLGQGGFGSVYLGRLPDGTQVAVKKLEGIGQGKKEFRAEVSIIGSIHHVHLVRLRGFCVDGAHRLLAYEYMSKGSLDRWIFPRRRRHEDDDEDDNQKLDWDKRYNIALGTAKGLAYLHEDCESKIVHCDIKPENVLLDEHFAAKVSDFGLAKLMTKEQSHVFTTLRGTRGYLAPEWITNYAISEKSDVYSFGMVLLEIVGGRKNYDPAESSEKAHFPSYALKMVGEGKLEEVVFDAKAAAGDRRSKVGERMETAIKVALWCIQEDMHLRPSMTKVVQMLEGLTDVPSPPPTAQVGFRLYANAFKYGSDDSGGFGFGFGGGGTTSSSGPSDCNSDALLSAVRLSGPR